MNQIEKTLIALGLTKTEASLYLAGLSHESVGVQQLAKETNIKRPTIYHSLHTLLAKGLVEELGRDGRLEFVMTPPDQLVRLVQKQKENLKHHEAELMKVIPILRQAKRSASEEISTVHYEGIEGIKTAVDIALYCKSREWDIIAPIKNFFSDFEKEYAEYYMNTRKQRGIVTRTLWEKGMRPGRRLTADEMRQRRPRIMPQSMQGKLKSVLIIFDNKVAIISSLEKLSATIITSQETHDMFKAVFEGLWEASEEYWTS